MTEEQMNGVDGEENLIASYGELEELEQKFVHSKIMLDWTRKSGQPFELRSIAIKVFRYDRKTLSIEADNRNEYSDLLGARNTLAENFRRSPFGSIIESVGDLFREEGLMRAANQDKSNEIDRGLGELLKSLKENLGSERNQIELLRSYLMNYAEKEGFRYVGKSKRLQEAINSISDKTDDARVGNDGELLEEEKEL